MGEDYHPARAQRIENDRLLSITTEPKRPDHDHAFTVCPRGPGCPYPIHCCDKCHRHSLIAHDCVTLGKIGR